MEKQLRWRWFVIDFTISDYWHSLGLTLDIYKGFSLELQLPFVYLSVDISKLNDIDYEC